MSTDCKLKGCQYSNENNKYNGFCSIHFKQMKELEDTVVSVYDHLKVNIEQTAKGARVTVTYDRSDHDSTNAAANAVELYKMTIGMLKHEGLKVDES